MITWIGGDELAGLYTASDVEVVPNLVKLTVLAADGYCVACYGREGGLDRGGCVGF